jgi:hypothetical protein
MTELREMDMSEKVATVETSTARPSKAAIWTGRVLSALPVLLMVFSASLKLSRTPAAVEGFSRFGYAEYLLVPLGIVELSCVVLYLIPQTAVLGAILMTGYLGGAVATHFRVSDPSFILPALLGVIAWLGLYLREPRLRALAPLRKKP